MFWIDLGRLMGRVESMDISKNHIFAILGYTPPQHFNRSENLKFPRIPSDLQSKFVANYSLNLWRIAKKRNYHSKPKNAVWSSKFIRNRLFCCIELFWVTVLLFQTFSELKTAKFSPIKNGDAVSNNLTSDVSIFEGGVAVVWNNFLSLNCAHGHKDWRSVFERAAKNTHATWKSKNCTQLIAVKWL